MPILIKATPPESTKIVIFRGRRGIGLADFITNILARGFRIIYIEFGRDGEALKVDELASMALCPHIEELDLSGSNLCIEDDTLFNVLSSCRGIRRLGLGAISDPSQGFDLLLLAPFLQHLTHLTLTCWWDLHPEALYMLAQLCPQLRVVLISHCELITSEDVSRMRSIGVICEADGAVKCF